MMSTESEKGHKWGTRSEDFKPIPERVEVRGSGIVTHFRNSEVNRESSEISSESLGWLEEDIEAPSRRVLTSGSSFALASISESNEVLSGVAGNISDQDRDLGSALASFEASRNGNNFESFGRVDFAGISAFIKRVSGGYGTTTYAFALSRTEDVDLVIEELEAHGEWDINTDNI